MDLDRKGLLDDDTAPSTFTRSLVIDLLSASWICLRNMDKGDLSESDGKLRGRKHETFGFNLCCLKSILRRSWSPDSILNDYLMKNYYCALFMNPYCTMGGESRILQERASSTPETLRPVSSSGLSRDGAWSLWLYKDAPPLHMWFLLCFRVSTWKPWPGN